MKQTFVTEAKISSRWQCSKCQRRQNWWSFEDTVENQVFSVVFTLFEIQSKKGLIIHSKLIEFGSKYDFWIFFAQFYFFIVSFLA